MSLITILNPPRPRTTNLTSSGSSLDKPMLTINTDEFTVEQRSNLADQFRTAADELDAASP